jgi:hypothetical protein
MSHYTIKTVRGPNDPIIGYPTKYSKRIGINPNQPTPSVRKFNNGDWVLMGLASATHARMVKLKRRNASNLSAIIYI